MKIRPDMVIVAIVLLALYVGFRVWQKTQEGKLARRGVVSPDEKRMRQLGFSDTRGTHWYLCKPVAKDVTFNLTIDKKTGEYDITVLDELFGQPEYYGKMKPVYRDAIMWNIDVILSELRAAGFDLKFDHAEYGVEKSA